MKKLIGCLVLFVIVQSGVSASEMRTWTSTKGDTIEARYVRMFAGGKVVIKTADGKELKIPVSGLCEADQIFLASLVPPKLKIEVDVDRDNDVVTSSDWYVRKRETSKCQVLIKKTNMELCSQTFKVHIYVFAGQEKGDNFWLITSETKTLSFADGSKEASFTCSPAEVEFVSSEYRGSSGFRYDGYLVVVESSSGEVIAMESSRKMYEKNWGKIKGSGEGAEFDKGFSKRANKRTRSLDTSYY